MNIIINSIKQPISYKPFIFTSKTLKTLYSNLDIFKYLTPNTTIKITLTPPISARTGHTTVSIDKDIYLFGGYDGTNILNDFYKIDTITSNVTTLYSNTNNKISKRVGHTMVAINTDIYIFGGTDNTNIFNDFYKIDTITNDIKYSNIIPEISNRLGHSMSTINNDIIITGGFNGTTTLNDFYKIDTTNCNVVYSNNIIGMPNRMFHTMVTINNEIIIFGGTNGIAKSYNDFYKINTSNSHILYSNNIMEISERFYHTMVSINTDIYIFGGFNDTNYLNDFYKIDTNCNITTLYSNNNPSNIITNRREHSMVTLNNDIIIFGGYNGINPLNDFYKLTYIPPVVIPPVVITDPTSDSIPFYIPTLSIKLETTPSIQIISPYYMAAIKNDIYIYESYKTGLLNTLYKIDTLTNKIVYSNNIRGISSRVSTMMVAINNDLYIFGGFDLKNYLNDFYKINTLTCNVSYSNIIPNIPGRRDHNMITIGNDIYIFGGFNIIGYEQSYLNDFHKISTLTCNVSYSKTFTEIQTRQQSSMAAINNNIYIFGGYNDGSFLNDFYKINTLTCNVSYINNNFGISKRRNHSMVAINSNLYIFGGYYYANSIGVKYNDYYRIDSTNCNISTIYNNSATNVIPVKSGHSMTTIGNDIYIFGDNGVINDFYKITKE